MILLHSVNRQFQQKISTELKLYQKQEDNNAEQQQGTSDSSHNVEYVICSVISIT